jgi:hypothetical protein
MTSGMTRAQCVTFREAIVGTIGKPHLHGDYLVGPMTTGPNALMNIMIIATPL